MDFRRPEDFYLKMVANVAVGDKPHKAVPEASDAEMQLFRKARRHLPKSVFNEEKWKAAVGEKLWRKVVYVLNRGGRFEDFEKGYDGEKVKHTYGKLINLYSEKAASAKNSMTGKAYSGIARYFPVTDALGKELADEKAGYDLHLITYREITMTKSRTISDYWLTAVLPENAILMNRLDAEKRGLKDGDEVQILSPTNPEGVWDLRNGRKKPVQGKVKVIEGIRPGVIAFSLGHGHWAYGSSDVVIDGEVIRGDPRRATGIHANAAMRIDPHLKDVTLQDLTGGSVAFYDSKVKVARV
jgi:anaerobic selenocysteine-containing dehydrogenase